MRVGLLAAAVVGALVLVGGYVWLARPNPAKPDAGGASTVLKPVRFELDAGDPIPAASAKVDASGGIVKVSRPGSPLDGFELEVPAGAFGAPTAVSLSHSPIARHNLPKTLTPLTPLIVIESGASTQDYTPHTVPIKLPEGQLAMAFAYDDKTGALEGLTTLALSKEAITVVGAPLCQGTTKELVVAFRPADYDNLDVSVDFEEGRDDWNTANYGSVVSPGGYCSGSCLTELWYFENEKLRAGLALRAQNPGGAGPNAQTPHFGLDDVSAIRLASMAQVSADTQRGKLYDRVSDYFWNLGARVSRLSHSEVPTAPKAVQFYSFAVSLKESGRAQLVAIYDESGKNGHVLVCYRVVGHTLFVEDPNHVGRNPGSNMIEFIPGPAGQDGLWTAYETAPNSRAWNDGERIRYTGIFFQGHSSAIGDEILGRYWQEFKSGSVGMAKYRPGADRSTVEVDPAGKAFFEYTLNLVELNDKNEKARDAFALNPRSVTRVTNKRIAVIPTAGGRSGEAIFYRLGDVLQWERSWTEKSLLLPDPAAVGMVELERGENVLGILVQFDDGRGAAWAGFDWVTISFEPTTTPTPVTPSATASPTPTASPSSTSSPTRTPTRTPAPSPVVARPFAPSDCLCGGSLTTTSRADGKISGLVCDWRVPAEVVRGTQVYDGYSLFVLPYGSNPTPAQVDQLFASTRKSVLATEPSYQTIQEDGGGRVTVTIRKPISGGVHVYGDRLVQTADKRYQLRASTSVSSQKTEQQVLTALKEIEACAVRAIARREAR